MDKPIITFETERLFARSITEADKDFYMDLRVNNSDISAAYTSMPGLRDQVWNSELNSEKDIYLAAFLKESGEFVASGSFQGFRTETIELGLDVVESYWNHGIATEFVKGLIRTARRLFTEKGICLKTNATNAACRRVAEKCGGTLLRNEPSIFAKSMVSFFHTAEEKGLDSDILEQMKRDNEKLLENKKEGVCVYGFSECHSRESDEEEFQSIRKKVWKRD